MFNVKTMPVRSNALVMLLALLSVISIPCLAVGAPQALVTAVTGPATISQGDGVQNPLLKNMELEQGHVIRTGEGGQVQLLIDGDSQVEIFPHSIMEIGDILPGEQNDLSLSLYLGRLAMDARSLAANDVVHTPLLTIGIRGTRFAVSVADDGASVVSVEHGRVQVSTERVGASDVELQLESGQEVEAEEQGQDLTPREIIINSFKEWDMYRLSRRQGMVQDLPQLAAHMERSIDPELERLDWIKLQPMNRADVLRELDDRLASLAPDDAAGQAQIIMQTHMEMARTQGLPERFRAQKTRLQAIFYRAELYQELVKGYFDTLGPQQAGVEETLERIKDREDEVLANANRISLVFRDSMTPIQEMFNRYSTE